MSKKYVPEVRLNGFSREWLSEDFGDFFDSSITKNTLSRANLTSDPTEVKNIHYGDILINFTSVLDAAETLHTYIKDAKLDQYKSQCLKDGDIIFADTAEDETVGKAIEIRIRSGQNVVSGLHTIPCRPKKQVKPFFLGHYLNSNAFHRQLLPLMQGTKVLSISKSSLNKTILKLPEDQAEQEKIGLTFQNIDHLIAHRSIKYQKLLNVKKAMLEKMFPKDGADVPEIRFKGFNDKWNQFELSSIFEIIDGDRGENYPGESDFFEIGDTLFLDTGNVRRFGFDFNNKKFITKEKDTALKNGKLKLCDFVLTSRGTLGNLAYYGKDVQNYFPSVRINSAMLILRPIMKKTIVDEYMATVLSGNAIDSYMVKNQVGSAQPHITKKDFSKMIVNVPKDMDEQKNIGLYFQGIYDLIDLQNLEIQKLKNLKKAMLEKMFV